ncbi:MAG: hypothetical protein C0624_07565 [Desulfuromonas sp.]|nr:MAG: hypothetical protein C0624_07565 [Desulfuromonas sp.]
MARGRILAIENDPSFRSFFEDVLRAEGYDVRTVDNGTTGLQLCRDDEFDLVVIEMNLPGMDGLEITQRIISFNPEQPIMVVTAQQDVDKALAALQKGVAEYLLKPIDPQKFLRSVNRLLFNQSLSQDHERLSRENHLLGSILSTYHKCMAFLSIPQLEHLADQILDVCMEVLKAEGTVFWLADPGSGSYSYSSHRGLMRLSGGDNKLTPGERERVKILEGEPAIGPQGKTLWIPLQHDMESLALIQAEMPAGRDTFTRRDMKNAASIGKFASSALFNVLRYQSLEETSLQTGVGQSYSMAYFQDHLGKELQKAHRYGRQLSLAQLVVENYTELKASFHDRDLQAGIEEVVARLREVLRDADVIATAKPNQYFILLPETDFWGAIMAQKRIRRALRGVTLSALKKMLPVNVALRSATYPSDGTDYATLGKVTKHRLEHLRESLFHREPLQTATFWDAVHMILGSSKDYRFTGDGIEVSKTLAPYTSTLHSKYFRMPEGRMNDVQRMFCLEIVESYRTRGVLFRSCLDFEQTRGQLCDEQAIEKTSTTVYLLGGDKRVSWDLQHIVPVHIPDTQFRKVHFLLYLSEDHAYGVFATEMQGDLVGFHTSDFFLVENMVVKLQEQYQLQTQI